jgi:HAD superfamily hydrolase (TIGR01549 family)
VLVIIGAVSGALLGGLLGVLLAAPVIASVRVIAGYAYRKLFDLEPFALPAVPAGEVEERELGLIAGRPVEAVLFDLDGTLVETDDALAEQLAERLEPVSRVLPGRDTDRAARRLVMASEGPANGVLTFLDKLGLDDESFVLARSLRRRKARKQFAEVRLVSGAVDVLRELADRYRLGIVTTRSLAEAKALLERHGLQDLVPVVVARDSTHRLKPHPLPVQEAAEQLGVDVRRCAMVGDTRVDLRAAKEAGAVAVAVLSGFGGRRDLADADITLEDVTELKRWL